MESGTAWAHNRYGKIVLAHECSKTEGPFHCHCGQKHRVHLSKPSGKEGKRPFEAYFAHNGEPGSKRQCLGGGGGGGESAIHLLGKALLQKRHGQYTFQTSFCDKCRSKKNETLTGGGVCLEHTDKALGYRYDCYWTDGRRRVALEVFNTHACTKEKLNSVKGSGTVLAEFHAQEIKDKLLEIAPGRKVWLNNLQVQKVTCASCAEKVTRQDAEREAKRVAEEAKRVAEEAEREAKRAKEEAEKEAKRAVEEAKREAKRVAEEAEKEAKRVAEEAEREAKRVAEEAEKEAKRVAEEAEREAKRAAEEAEREAKRMAEEAEAAERRAKRVAGVIKKTKQAILLAWQSETAEIQAQAQKIEDEYCSKDAVLFPGLYKLTFGKHMGDTVQSVDMEGWSGVQYLFWMTGRKLDYRHPRMIKVMTTEALEVVRSLYPQAILAAENFINKTYHLRCLDCYVEVDKPWKCLCMECWWRRKDGRYQNTQGRLQM